MPGSLCCRSHAHQPQRQRGHVDVRSIGGYKKNSHNWALISPLQGEIQRVAEFTPKQTRQSAYHTIDTINEIHWREKIKKRRLAVGGLREVKKGKHNI